LTASANPESSSAVWEFGRIAGAILNDAAPFGPPDGDHSGLLKRLTLEFHESFEIVTGHFEVFANVWKLW